MIFFWSISEDEWVNLDNKTLKTEGKSDTSSVWCSQYSTTGLKWMHFQFLHECVWKDGDRQTRGPFFPFCSLCFSLQKWLTSHQLFHFSPLSRSTKGRKYKPGSWCSNFATASAQWKPLSMRNKQRDVYFTTDSKCMWGHGE